MRHEDGARPRGHPRRERRGIDVAGALAEVDEDRAQPGDEHGVDDVGDRHRRHQHLAPARQIEGEGAQDRQQRDAGVRQEHGLAALEGYGEAPLEGLDRAPRDGGASAATRPRPMRRRSGR